jgi:hypothetical protein
MAHAAERPGPVMRRAAVSVTAKDFLSIKPPLI